MSRNAELTRKRDKPKSQLTVYEKAGEWQDLRDELAQAIKWARFYSRKVTPTSIVVRRNYRADEQPPEQRSEQAVTA